MSATLLDGQALAEKLKAPLREAVARLAAAGRPPALVALQVGKNPASAVYLRNQRKGCEELGVAHRVEELPDSTSEAALLARLAELGRDPAVTGVIVQMPLPAGLDPRRVREALPPAKDVEGMHPANLGRLVHGAEELAPCTARAALELLRLATGGKLYGLEVCVVGHSEIVGRPLALLLLKEFCTVTECHIATKDLAAHTRQAEALVVAVGKPNLIRREMIRPGAIVIDVGINSVPVLDAAGQPVRDAKGRAQRRIVGDVDFEAVREVAGWITPVPGGVGPVTSAILMANVVAAAERQAAI
jgi:methylenetetrahydrofolate dehydrogenase (NADP+)/methenyltetrahydrofolate cyclohydrolase